MKGRLLGLVLVCVLLLVFYFPMLDWILKSSQSVEWSEHHRTFNGLLRGEEHDRCKSRLEQHRYRRKTSQYVPSPYLLQRLRAYEEFHARCTRDYLKSFQNSTTGSINNSQQCKFIVWRSCSGLGNKIISVAATFAYALLTNRVLLVEPGPENNLVELLCEPFPASSWFLSRDFSLQLFDQDEHRLKFDDAHHCKADLEVEGYGLIEITHRFERLGDKFFCENEQDMLSEKVPWLAIVVNLYFVPSLYNVPSFKRELDMLFPEQETVFHHLGRYLFHPSNRVWDRTVRFYEDNMDNASKVVGVQMRLLDHLGYKDRDHEHFRDTMLQCIEHNGLLPKSMITCSAAPAGAPRKSIAAVVTSLDGMYSERLRELYLDSTTEDGSQVRVVSPSQEVLQKVDDVEQEEKALAEMFLLSFCDELVTSPGSTFGYVGHGLAGIKAWVLESERDCSRMVSIELCFHARVTYGCECAPPKDAVSVQQNVQNCQDLTWGIQLKSLAATNSSTSQ